MGTKNNIDMVYKTKRFSTYISGDSFQSEETTINGKTRGSVRISHKEKRPGHKLTGKTLKFRYHA